ncbi:MAG: hypothetical protein NVS3B28_20690 [Candidatus Velthaea sp.]
MRHLPNDAIEAIYQLRDAVEQKVHAEYRLASADTAEARDALLDATLRVEEKTQDAIESSLRGMRPYDLPSAQPKSRLSDVHGNVLGVDFRPQFERDRDEDDQAR